MTSTPRTRRDQQPAGPNARRRQLGYRLLELRNASGLSAEQAGEAAGVSKATVSRYERGKGNVRWNQVDQLCRVYGLSDEDRAELVELAKNSKNTEGWWVPYAGSLTKPMLLLLALENESPAIRHHSVGVVPGLLQTLDYARAIRTADEEMSAEETEQHLEMRMKRQHILDRDEAPPEYRVVLDEAVLRRSVGGPAVMAAQCEHLLKRGGQPHVTIQVLPFAAGALVAGLSSFIHFAGSDPALDTVFIESQVGSLFLETPTERDRYRRDFDFLCRRALDPDASASLIAEAAHTHLHPTERGPSCNP
ncbi:helix-turn-helix domain-containing protein [Streptomyces clavuligerus]|uniref:helix-turn-helix domain-containing protein n=1 Tax=Streptomyces clavuligerus TaxID=1901 RepID=UPI00020D9335|nr:helix-turn-helix transcriptional regulator [Streptomyces clavuligerus]WDN55976.1 helix-turn-helix domain-containing protein [Streptomyces clavuligerus]